MPFLFLVLRVVFYSLERVEVDNAFLFLCFQLLFRKAGGKMKEGKSVLFIVISKRPLSHRCTLYTCLVTP